MTTVDCAHNQFYTDTMLMHYPPTHQEVVCHLVSLELAAKVAQAKADAARAAANDLLSTYRHLLCSNQVDHWPYGPNGKRFEPCRGAPVRHDGLCQECGKSADEEEEASFQKYYEEELSGTPDWTPRSSFATNSQQAYRTSMEQATRADEEARREKAEREGKERAARIAAGPRIAHASGWAHNDCEKKA